MNIRRAVLGDAPGIQILNQQLGYDFPAERTTAQLETILANKAHCVIVAESDGIIAGYIHLQDYDTLYFPHMKNVLALVVSKDHRRKGIASGLLKAGEQWAKDSGASGIRLDSGIDRVGAHACYRKAKYQEVKLHKYFKKLF